MHEVLVYLRVFVNIAEFFLCKFSGLNGVDTPISHATNAEYLQD